MATRGFVTGLRRNDDDEDYDASACLVRVPSHGTSGSLPLELHAGPKLQRCVRAEALRADAAVAPSTYAIMQRERHRDRDLNLPSRKRAKPAATTSDAQTDETMVERDVQSAAIAGGQEEQIAPNNALFGEALGVVLHLAEGDRAGKFRSALRAVSMMHVAMTCRAARAVVDSSPVWLAYVGLCVCGTPPRELSMQLLFAELMYEKSSGMGLQWAEGQELHDHHFGFSGGSLGRLSDTMASLHAASGVGEVQPAHQKLRPVFIHALKVDGAAAWAELLYKQVRLTCSPSRADLEDVIEMTDGIVRAIRAEAPMDEAASIILKACADHEELDADNGAEDDVCSVQKRERRNDALCAAVTAHVASLIHSHHRAGLLKHREAECAALASLMARAIPSLKSVLMTAVAYDRKHDEDLLQMAGGGLQSRIAALPDLPKLLRKALIHRLGSLPWTHLAPGLSKSRRGLLLCILNGAHAGQLTKRLPNPARGRMSLLLALLHKQKYPAQAGDREWERYQQEFAEPVAAAKAFDGGLHIRDEWTSPEFQPSLVRTKVPSPQVMSIQSLLSRSGNTQETWQLAFENEQVSGAQVVMNMRSLVLVGSNPEHTDKVLWNAAKRGQLSADKLFAIHKRMTSTFSADQLAELAGLYKAKASEGREWTEHDAALVTRLQAVTVTLEYLENFVKELGENPPSNDDELLYVSEVDYAPAIPGAGSGPGGRGRRNAPTRWRKPRKDSRKYEQETTYHEKLLSAQQAMTETERTVAQAVENLTRFLTERAKVDGPGSDEAFIRAQSQRTSSTLKAAILAAHGFKKQTESFLASVKASAMVKEGCLRVCVGQRTFKDAKGRATTRKDMKWLCPDVVASGQNHREAVWRALEKATEKESMHGREQRTAAICVTTELMKNPLRVGQPPLAPLGLRNSAGMLWRGETVSVPELVRRSGTEPPVDDEYVACLTWCEPGPDSKHYTGRSVCLDLAALVYDESYDLLDSCDYTKFYSGGLSSAEESGLRHSIVDTGDITSAPFPGGAREFIEVSPAKIRAQFTTARYVVFTINSWNSPDLDALHDATFFLARKGVVGVGPGDLDPICAARCTGSGKMNIASSLDLESQEYTMFDTTLNVGIDTASRSSGTVVAELKRQVDPAERAARLTLMEQSALWASQVADNVVLLTPESGSTTLQRDTQEQVASFAMRVVHEAARLHNAGTASALIAYSIPTAHPDRPVVVFAGALDDHRAIASQNSEASESGSLTVVRMRSQGVGSIEQVPCPDALGGEYALLHADRSTLQSLHKHLENT